MHLGIQDVGKGETEGIDRCVRHLHRGGYVRVERRLHLQGPACVDLFGVDTGCAAGLHELVHVGDIVFGKGYEEAVGGIDAMRGYPAKDAVLFDAFARRHAVGDGIPRAAVQQTVVAAGGTVAEIGFLYQEHAQSAPCAIPGRSRSRNAPADYEDIVFFVVHFAFRRHLTPCTKIRFLIK